ncbi:MAG: hypothetical protein CL902_00435 [Dehalococcoidia bacterium]|nr:hypothetical protein [Dehalococcoidia bacterium]
MAPVSDRLFEMPKSVELHCSSGHMHSVATPGCDGHKKKKVELGDLPYDKPAMQSTEMHGCDGHKKKKVELGGCSGGHKSAMHSVELHCGACGADEEAGHHHAEEGKKVGLASCSSRAGVWDRVYKNLKDFEPDDHVFINALPAKYGSCDVARWDGEDVDTHSEMGSVPRGSACAVYCAHSGCDAAKKFAKKHKADLLDKCDEIVYLPGGARDMMRDAKYELKDGLTCKKMLG